MKQIIKQAGYKYCRYLGNREHLLRNIAGDSAGHEVFVTNKDHASWGLIYKNTHLEFVRSATNEDLLI